MPRGRGRASKRRRSASNGDDDDESAYTEDEESEYDESEESYESAESEEYESGSDEDYSDEEEYGRPKGRNRSAPRPAYNNMAGAGGFYNQWAAGPMAMQPGMRPMMPMRPMLAPRPLPPLVNAAMPQLVRALAPQGGVRPMLTAAQLQEIARSTVQSLLAGGAPMPPPPAPRPEGELKAEAPSTEDSKEKAEAQETEQPKEDGQKEGEKAQDGESKQTEGESKPTEDGEAKQAENAEQIKASVSDEIKQNLTRMLTDPQAKVALMQQLLMNQMARMQQQPGGMPQGAPFMMPPQGMMFRPPMGGPYMMPPGYRPMMPRAPMMPMQQQHQKQKERRVRKPMKYDGGSDDDAPIASRRATRSAAKKVDFSRLYQEEDEMEEQIEQYAEAQASGSEGEGEQRPKKIVLAMRQQDDLSEIQPEIKSGSGPRRGRKPRSRQASEDEEGTDEEDGGLARSGSSTPSTDEPSVSKILSHRVNSDGGNEFLVKFHGLSYLHVEWISEEEMLEAKMGAMRVKKFLSKPLSEHHYDDRHPYNPDYEQIDRIVYGWDHPTAEDPKVWSSSYLVKWKGLPYDEATWEKKETLVERCPDFEDRLADWQARPQLASRRDPGQLRIGQRPDRSTWQALPESPVYRHDNTLRSYQLEGVNWLVYCWINKQSCIIADEMGLGKTVQSVAFIELLQKQFRVPGPFLVVAPLSTIPHWEREFQAWTNLNVIVYHGNIASRDLMHEHEFYYKDDQDRIIPNAYRFDVLITTYEMALAGFDTLQPIIWRAGIFDEAHRLKNRGSKAAEVLSLFRLEHKVMLTGTPLQNNLEELFALLHFLQPQRFASEEEFLEQYGNLERSEDVTRLQELLRPLMLRRLKEDVEKSIPVKEETVIEVELTALQKRYYRAILERNFAFLAKGSKGNNAPNLVNTMMELRKCCIHPFLIKGSEERILSECGAQSHEEVMQCMIQASGKLVLVDKLLKRLREQGHKVLIFSQMTRCLDLLSDFLTYRGYPWERIDGAVKGEDRQAAIDRYCAPGSDSFVFLLCTRAGGVGINLTVADTVVIYDSDWNPQNDLQAQARCHRIGQEKSVKVYRLITRNTYEREMFDKAGLKLGLDRAILQRMTNAEAGGGVFSGAHAPQLSKGEVETLLKKGAYGLLMEGGDEDSQRFCEEDIDSILSRRTQVIRHGGASAEGGESAGAGGSSLFSKATFAATADDYDIDLDDPNFWELWAKRLGMNSKDMLAGSGQSIDEPRIRRQAKRLRTASLLEIPLPALDEHEKQHPSVKPGAPRLWTGEERNRLLDLLLRFGPNRLADKIIPAFPDRTRNDLVACIRALVRFCLEHGTPSGDRNFRDDCERLLLSNMDFDRDTAPTVVDDTTGNIDLLAVTELEDTANQANDDGENSQEADAKTESRGDRPWPSATRQQTAEFASFLKGAPSSWLDAVKENAESAALRMQLVDFLRDVVESNGEASLPVPPLPGATPAEGWGRKDDQAILLSAYHNGYGAWYDELPGEADEIESKKNEADLEEVSSRFVKLVMAIVKRSQAAAKLAMHEAVSARTLATARPKTARRRRRRDDDDEASGSDAGTESDLDDDEFVAEPEEEKPKRGRRAGAASAASSAPTTNYNVAIEGTTKVFWSAADQREFIRVVRGYGLPTRSEDGSRDWSTFILLGSFSPAAKAYSHADFDEYAAVFMSACERSANARKRRRTKREMEAVARGEPEPEEVLPGELVPSDELPEEMADDTAEEKPAGNGPYTVSILLATGRARNLLDTIALMDALRDPAFQSPTLSDDDLASLLSRARRLSILPRWWRAGSHDAAILRAVAKYGFERDDLILADKQLPFNEVFVELGKVRPLTDKEKTERKAQAKSGLPVLDDVEIQRTAADWPALDNLITRVKKMYEMATGKAPAYPLAITSTASLDASPVKKPVKRARKPKASAIAPPEEGGQDDPDAEFDAEEEAPETPKKKAKRQPRKKNVDMDTD